MRISVEHSTVYRYNNPVFLDPHTFRFRPRANGAQQLLEFEIHIFPGPVGMTECLDQDGNLVLHTWFDGATWELSVRSRFKVQLLRENPFDFALVGESWNLPLWYSQPLSVALAPYRNDMNVGEEVRLYAQALAAGAQWNALSFLASLNWQLFVRCRHVTRPEGAPWPSSRTLGLLEGSCRDLTVLFCDICRVMGIAARFVSGYECAAAGRPDSYMHAWAEVYLPGAGWRGYDPSRGLAVANSHVAVAAGFVHDLASPVAGMFSGGSGSQMEATVRMNVDPDSRASD